MTGRIVAWSLLWRTPIGRNGRMDALSAGSVVAVVGAVKLAQGGERAKEGTGSVLARAGRRVLEEQNYPVQSAVGSRS